MDAIFKGIFDTELTQGASGGELLLCLGVSLVLGLMISGAYMLGRGCSKSFLITLVLLPSAICVVIMMVNGNLGAGVAVAGAFSLVRFRSAPGSAKEMIALFIAMSVGLITGMGYLGFAALFTVIMCAVLLICNAFIRDTKLGRLDKTLKITIPEDLDYSSVFDGIFEEYTKTCELIKVKTTNMGSMFCLTYDLTLKDDTVEKQMIDRIRERNGNLEITVSRRESSISEL